ncbi:MAG: ATP-binding cassette domain-containing protein, partial [Salinisphaeraceae bacterium]|nr:ATP-binding cassette domain-containing protein [Salinisphaeraceae bacterium]
MPAALEIQALNKRYGELVALQDVSLCIEQGEYFGLLGPNGAGKSTLINIVASLVRASSGQVAILGYDLQREFRAARKAL